MSVTIEQVEKIAGLAKLSFSEQEKLIFVDQFNQILEYVEKLDELDTQNVEPTSHILGLTNVMRSDTRRASMPRDKVLLNAPAKKAGCFSVPKVIG